LTLSSNSGPYPKHGGHVSNLKKIVFRKDMHLGPICSFYYECTLDPFGVRRRGGGKLNGQRWPSNEHLHTIKER